MEVNRIVRLKEHEGFSELKPFYIREPHDAREDKKKESLFRIRSVGLSMCVYAYAFWGRKIERSDSEDNVAMRLISVLSGLTRIHGILM